MKFLKLISTTTIFLWSNVAWAEVESESKELDWLDWTFENLVLVISGFILLVAMQMLYSATKTIWRVQTIADFEKKGMSHAVAVKQAKQESFFSYIYQQLDGGVDLEHEEDVLLNHDYDGIRELDNNLPPWWVGMFYISILFAFAYIGIFHFSSYAQSSVEIYEQEVLEGKIIRAKFAEAKRLKKEEESQDDLAFSKRLTDAQSLSKGEELFNLQCAACHKKDGGGSTGPNMTDEYWIHGGAFTDIVKVIVEGVPGKNMISWKEVLKPEQIQQVASYILTLQGTNPPNAKDPEGEKFVADNSDLEIVEGEEEIK